VLSLELKGVLRGLGRIDRVHDLDTLARTVSERADVTSTLPSLRS